MRTIIFLCMLILGGCRLSESESTLLPIANVATDTVFHLKKSVGSQAPKISLCAVGYLNDSASIILKNPRQPEKLYWTIFKLPKGKVDSLTGTFDYYDSDIDIQYQHQNTGQGDLKLIVKY